MKATPTPLIMGEFQVTRPDLLIDSLEITKICPLCRFLWLIALVFGGVCRAVVRVVKRLRYKFIKDTRCARGTGQRHA